MEFAGVSVDDDFMHVRKRRSDRFVQAELEPSVPFGSDFPIRNAKDTTGLWIYEHR